MYQKVDEKTGDATNPNAEHPEPMMPVDHLSDPPDKPLNERAGHRAGGVVEMAKVTQDQGHLTKTSMSAPSASRNHPADDAKKTDPGRLSEDSGDMMDCNECCPDRPTEPPDRPEGTMGQRVKTRVLEALRGIEDGPGKDGNEEH